MTDEKPPSNNRHGITGAVISAGETLMRVMPPAFLLLLIFNILFLVGIAWAFDHNANERNALLAKIVEKCLQR